MNYAFDQKGRGGVRGKVYVPDEIECFGCGTKYNAAYRMDARRANAVLRREQADWVVVFSTCCKLVIYAMHAPPGVKYEECSCGREGAHPLMVYGFHDNPVDHLRHA